MTRRCHFPGPVTPPPAPGAGALSFAAVSPPQYLGQNAARTAPSTSPATLASALPSRPCDTYRSLRSARNVTMPPQSITLQSQSERLFIGKPPARLPARTSAYHRLKSNRGGHLAVAKIGGAAQQGLSRRLHPVLQRVEVACVLTILLNDERRQRLLGLVEAGKPACRAAGVEPSTLEHLARRRAGGSREQHAVAHHRALSHRAADADQRALADDAVGHRHVVADSGIGADADTATRAAADVRVVLNVGVGADLDGGLARIEDVAVPDAGRLRCDQPAAHGGAGRNEHRGVDG